MLYNRNLSEKKLSRKNAEFTKYYIQWNLSYPDPTYPDS